MTIGKFARRQRGAIGLIVIVTVGLVGLTGGLFIKVAMDQEEHRGRVMDDIHNNREVSEEDLERARLTTVTNLKLGKATGDLVTAIDVGIDDSGQSLVSAYGSAANGKVAERGLTDPPTESRPLPADLPPPAPSCDSRHRYLCNSYSSCSRAGGYWADGSCYSTPQYICGPGHLDLCDSETDCAGAGGYWYDHSCNGQPQALCNRENLDLCTDSSACSGAGGYWYDRQCNVSPEACYVDVTQCLDSFDCGNAGGFWYDNQCNTEEEACNGSNLDLCTDTGSCGSAGGYWYSNTCNATPDMYVCEGGSEILRELVCNGTSNCPMGDDEANCGSGVSCCIATNGCPSETATSCGETCCCCPYGQACDQSNPANGCVPSQ